MNYTLGARYDLSLYRALAKASTDLHLIFFQMELGISSFALPAGETET